MPAVADLSVTAVGVPGVRWPARAGMVLLVLAVTYNLPLAIINAQLFAISRNTVILVEALLMGFGLLLALAHWRAEMTRWLLMIIAFFALSLVLSQLRQTFDPKSFRDTLMFAVLIMVGMLVPWRDARRVLVGLHIAILIVMLFEVLLPVQFGSLLDPRAYFISTRGFTPEQFYGDSNLFGAARPGERYMFPWLGWNRASSLFLEPLSLGNYVSFAVLAIMMFWRDWSVAMRLFMAVSTAVILVGSDGRFAATSALLLLLLAPFFTRLSALLAVFYLPIGILLARVLSQSLNWRPLNDDFPGRMARGMKQLFRLDWYEAWGFSIPTPALADSGIAYLVMAQSLPGVVMLQLFLFLQPAMQRPQQRLYLHGTALTFALSILVSISMLSIKTAGFYWFLMGVVIVLAADENARRPMGPAGI